MQGLLVSAFPARCTEGSKRQQVFGKLTMLSNSVRIHLFRKNSSHLLLRMTSKYINVEGNSGECVGLIPTSGSGEEYVYPSQQSCQGLFPRCAGAEFPSYDCL